jgi:hypothetical protein
LKAIIASPVFTWKGIRIKIKLKSEKNSLNTNI